MHEKDCVFGKQREMLTDVSREPQSCPVCEYEVKWEFWMGPNAIFTILHSIFRVFARKHRTACTWAVCSCLLFTLPFAWFTSTCIHFILILPPRRGRRRRQVKVLVERTKLFLFNFSVNFHLLWEKVGWVLYGAPLARIQPNETT